MIEKEECFVFICGTRIGEPVIKCTDCVKTDCEHVRTLNDNSNDEALTNFIHFESRPLKRKQKYIKRCLSTNKIPFSSNCVDGNIEEQYSSSRTNCQCGSEMVSRQEDVKIITKTNTFPTTGECISHYLETGYVY